MSDPGAALREYQARLAKDREEQQRYRAELQRNAKRYRFAWIEGHDTLYKFKSMQGSSRSQVQDIIENSRLYFSMPDQFNDPLDCAPVFKLAKSASDPAFVAELLAEQEQLIAESGKSDDEVEELRREAIDIHRFGAAVTEATRQAMRRDVRVFCLSARQDHPLLWSHYADSHRGVCLHFRCSSGTLIGAARAVRYRTRRLPILVPLHYNRRGIDDMSDRMVQVKADFWSYEKEYRIIGHEGVDWGHKLEGRYCSFPPELLCGISLGLNISPSDKNVVINWATSRAPALRVYETLEDTGRFGMQFRWIA